MCRSILIVEDNLSLRKGLILFFKAKGFSIEGVSSGEDALIRLGEMNPSVIILDLNLPGISGVQTAQKIKENKKWSDIPIVVLTGVDLEEMVIKSLEQFADDYIIKPITPPILLARINALLRRLKKITSEPPSQNVNIRIDIEAFEVTVDNVRLELTKTELFILYFLMNNKNRAFSRSQIINSVKGTDYHIEERSIDYQIFGLRKKLGPHAWMVSTVRGIGFKFTDGH